MKKSFLVLLCMLLFLTACSGGNGPNSGFTEEENTCQEAVKLLEAGDLQGAYDLFLSIKDSPEAAEYLENFVFRYARKTTKDNYESTESVYEYDEYGRVVKIEKTIDNEYRDSYTEYTMYEYDEQNRVIQYNHTRYEYDENGNIAKVTRSNGTTAEFAYDGQGNRIEETYKTVDGEIYLTYTHEYNEHGDVVKSVKDDIYAGGRFTFTYEYQYDGDGRMIQMVSGTVTDKWEYDEFGREIRYERQETNGYYYIRSSKYDEYGNLSEQATEKPLFLGFENAKHTTGTYEREYNEYGVILWEKYYENGNLMLTSEYDGVTLYYNPDGQPELPDEYLGVGS